MLAIISSNIYQWLTYVLDVYSCSLSGPFGLLVNIFCRAAVMSPAHSKESSCQFHQQEASADSAPLETVDKDDKNRGLVWLAFMFSVVSILRFSIFILWCLFPFEHWRLSIAYACVCGSWMLKLFRVAQTFPGPLLCIPNKEIHALLARHPACHSLFPTLWLVHCSFHSYSSIVYTTLSRTCIGFQFIASRVNKPLLLKTIFSKERFSRSLR